MRAAVTHDDVVVNVVEVDDDWTADDETAWHPGAGHDLVPLPDDSPVAPGWHLTPSGELVAPEEPAEPPPAAPTPQALMLEIQDLQTRITELGDQVQQLVDDAAGLG